MEPLAVLRTLWTYKWVTLPIVVLTALACVYGLLWAPRTYESDAIHALAMPDVPSEFELEQDPGLAQLNQDNPYLRWRDTSLLTQVVVARMNSDEMAEALESQGLATDFEVVAAEGAGSGLLRIVVQAEDPDQATATVTALGLELERTLREVQKVNQADDLYLVRALPVSGPTPAEEVFSSRLRFTLVLGAAGALILFGAVSFAQSVSAARGRSRLPQAVAPGPESPSGGARDADLGPGAAPRRASGRGARESETTGLLLASTDTRRVHGLPVDETVLDQEAGADDAPTKVATDAAR